MFCCIPNVTYITVNLILGLEGAFNYHTTSLHQIEDQSQFWWKVELSLLQGCWKKATNPHGSKNEYSMVYPIVNVKLSASADCSHTLRRKINEKALLSWRLEPTTTMVSKLLFVTDIFGYENFAATPCIIIEKWLVKWQLLVKKVVTMSL